MLAGAVVVISALFSGEAKSFERDLHFSVTFALALVTGWSWEEARIIASADQGIDENLDTRPSYSITEQPYAGLSGQDYLFHCFSRRKDRIDQRDDYVITNMLKLESEAHKAIDQAKQSNSKGDWTRALIAIGVYLHCQEDSWPHSGYGGTRLGHMPQNVTGESPDHPARNPAVTQEALKEKLEKLLSFVQRSKGYAPEISRKELEPLIRGLTSRSSLEMEDAHRIACNQAIAEHWLYLMLKKQGKLVELANAPESARAATTVELPRPPAKIIRGGTMVFDYTCENAYRDAFADGIVSAKLKPFEIDLPLPSTMVSAVKTPNPKYPILDADGKPRPGTIDEATGKYQQ